MKIRFFALLLLVCLCLFTVRAEENFTPLFNGKDLSGWTPIGEPGAFAVKKNAIFTTGAGPYPTWLRTEKEYENFVLRFEFQTEGWYEGGVLIHAPADGPASKLGLKLHLRHDQKKYGARSPGAIYDAAAPMAIANKPSGQWNQCEIVCDWPTLKVTLNGELIHNINMENDDAFRHRLRSGFVGIQNIGCKGYFKNIEIKTLPGKEQWTDLFKDGLDGFHLHEKTEWSLADGVLTGKGQNGFASSKEEFDGPMEFQAWCKTIVNGNGGVHFNWAGDGHGIEVQCFNSPDSTNPTGSLYGIAPAQRIVSYDEEWFLLQVFSDGPHAMVRVNGENVCESSEIAEPHRGSVAFQQHTPGTVIQYRDAKIIKRNWR
ncbi:MAG: DUF1080 domain-containing protein [Candidatus Hinthialibacter antarcticus]|nr:DUF1080 domain-containing protein [Candidatus Hinthialibacter antarcticus]